MHGEREGHVEGEGVVRVLQVELARQVSPLVRQDLVLDQVRVRRVAVRQQARHDRALQVADREMTTAVSQPVPKAAPLGASC
jgi:hypothetical protein